MTSSIGFPKIFFAAVAPVTIAGLIYLGVSTDWKSQVYQYLTGSSWAIHGFLVLVATLNWKSLPLAWTARVFHSVLYHTFWERSPLPPRALFHYSITSTRNTLLDTDYNMHKSNSTYFLDLDISRTHLISHLLTPGIQLVTYNARSQLVRDTHGNVVPGAFGIGLGAVSCSFRREISMFQGYEMWSRILAWDHKWVYCVTYFVVRGKVRPTAWDGRRAGPTRPCVVRSGGTAHGPSDAPDWSKYVIATGMAKYVFKLGRFTVHPSFMLEASGLLPERPGTGWRGGETEDLGDVDEHSDGDWDWRRVEYERRKGMQLAEKFAALESADAQFDGGEDGSLGVFPLG